MTNESKYETHPSYAVAVVTRSSGSGRPLFQSDLLHNQTITLAIHQADRARDLNHDWVHPGRTLVEVEMSLAQWGSLVSSIGIGSGVPVTLIRTENSQGRIEETPFTPRMKENLNEVDAAVTKLLERVKVTAEALDDAIDNKRGVKAIRQAQKDHKLAVEHAAGNAKFAVSSLAGAAEQVVSQAKADIESSILTASRLTGASPIEAPSFQALDTEEVILLQQVYDERESE